MTATPELNQSAEALSLDSSSPSASQPVSIPKQVDRQEIVTDRQAELAYIESLRRSIQQMRNGDVQPVREGLEELRRELDADVEDNLVDN